MYSAVVTYLIKAVELIFAVTLLGFAGLQLNDPDPVAWAGFYVLCALIPLLLVFNIYHRLLFWMAIGACLLRLSIAAPGAVEYFQHRAQEPLMQAMNPDKPYIEEAREFLGVLIALIFVVCSATLTKLSLVKLSARGLGHSAKK